MLQLQSIFFAQIQQQCGLQLYDGNLDRFCAAGDEQGLLIMIRPSLKKWLPNTKHETIPDIYLQNAAFASFFC